MYIIWYNQVAAIAIGRIIAGFAHGFTYIALVSHAGENAVTNFRGRTLASTNFFITLGIFLFTLLQYSASNSVGITVERLIGIITLVLSAVAIILIPFFTYESVAFLFYHGKDQKALHNMVVLRSETSETVQIQHDYQDMRMMVTQDRLQSINIFSEGNVRPLLLMSGVRLLAFFTNNRLINAAQIVVGVIVLRTLPLYVTSLILASSRVIIAIVPMCVTDSIRRRLQFIISGLLSGSFLLLFGILAVSLFWFASSSYVLVAIFIIFQCVTSFGVDPLQDVLMGEAFSLRKKIWSITFITVCEYGLHAIFIGIYAHVALNEGFVYGVTFTMAVFILSLTLILYFNLPETLDVTLRRARDEFNMHHQQSSPGVTIHARGPI